MGEIKRCLAKLSNSECLHWNSTFLILARTPSTCACGKYITNSAISPKHIKRIEIIASRINLPFQFHNKIYFRSSHVCLYFDLDKHFDGGVANSYFKMRSWLLEKCLNLEFKPLKKFDLKTKQIAAVGNFNPLKYFCDFSICCTIYIFWKKVRFS